MLPVIRLGARPAPRRRPVADRFGARSLDRFVDRLLGVSRRRRHAGYMALAAGIGLLKPMLRRAGALVGVLVLVAATSAYLRFVF